MIDTTQTQKLQIEDREYETFFTKKFAGRRHYHPPDPRKILCVIPGVILKIHVQPGKKVLRNDPLLVLEAMKMENIILSPADGRIKAVNVEIGKMVPKGTVLVELE
jgi:biotin carboxyl carrier protein